MAKDKKKNSDEILENSKTSEQETVCNEEENKPDEKDVLIEELNKKLTEANDKYLRTVAEYDNFRKRSQKEKEAIYSDSKTDILGKLLPVIDNFERACAVEDNGENYKKGVEMSLKQMFDVFSSLGVTAFGEKGEEFDPNIHNGIMHVDDETLGENVISEVYMKGYKAGDKVIRHATVIVAN